MSATTSHRLLSRLNRDLAELLAQPYPGVSVFLNEENIRRFCLVLTPPSGPWTGLNLHFDVSLPDSWPAEPPVVTSSVGGIQHPNLFGDYICCDLLKNYYELERGYTGGYTPALTLRGLFLQFLTFFSTTSVEQDYGGAIEIGDLYIVKYVREEDLAKVLTPFSNLYVPVTSPATHQSGERLWNEDPTEPTKLTSYASNGVAITHYVKGSEPHPDRLHKMLSLNPRWQNTLDRISHWTCKKCEYGTEKLPHNVLHRSSADAKAPTTDPETTPGYMLPPRLCLLDEVADDVLLEFANNMPSESVITFGQAYTRFHTLITAHHLLVQRELHCFFLKTPLHQGILGVGVAFDAGPRTLSSDFDWLSLEAFSLHGVRRSVQKREFGFFLPLAFNKHHFFKAKDEIWKNLREIDLVVRQADADLRSRTNNGNVARRGRGGPRGRGGHSGSAGHGTTVGPPAKPHHVVNVLYRMMNNIVVALMKSCDDALEASRRHSSKAGLLTASEKAIISYCHLMHLLICLSRSHPVVLQDAQARLQAFIKSPDNRTKAVEPDMGELIVLMTFVLIMTPSNQANAPTWAMMNGHFLEEAVTRNARWVLKDAPELEVMEEGASDYRLETTFAKSRTSLRLIMFQVTFLDLFIQTYHQLGIKALDDNYGFPTKELPEKMVDEIKEIYKVENWPAFFTKVRFGKARSSFTKEIFTGMLRGAIEKSKQRGYHQPAPRGRLQDLHHIRKALEKAREEAKTRK